MVSRLIMLTELPFLPDLVASQSINYPRCPRIMLNVPSLSSDLGAQVVATRTVQPQQTSGRRAS